MDDWIEYIYAYVYIHIYIHIYTYIYIYIYIYDYFSGMKKKAVLKFATTKMDLMSSMLRETSQTPKTHSV